MDFYLAILRHDLMPGRQLLGHYARRVAVAGGCGVLVLLLYLGFALSAALGGSVSLNLGWLLVLWLGALAMLVAALGAPYLAASSLLRERESRAWDMLRLTGFSVPGLVAARGTLAGGRTLLMLGGLAPIFLLGIGLGGADLRQGAVVLAVLAGQLMAGCGCGLLLGAWMLSRHRLGGAVLVILVAHYIGLPLAAQELVNAGLIPAHWPVVCSPVRVFVTVIWVGGSVDLGDYLLLHAAIGLAGALLAMLLLPRRLWVADANRRRALNSAWMRGPRWLRPRLIGNPLVWKDFMVHHRGILGQIVRYGFVVSLVTLAVYAGGSALGLAFADCLPWIAGAIAGVSALTVLTSFVGRLCDSFRLELNEHSLELLMATDLLPSEIVFGKQLAVYQSLVVDILGGLAAITYLVWVYADAGVWVGVGALLAIGTIAAIWYPVAGAALLGAVVSKRYGEFMAAFLITLVLGLGLPLMVVLTIAVGAVATPLAALLVPPLLALPGGVLLRYLAVLALDRRRRHGFTV